MKIPQVVLALLIGAGLSLGAMPAAAEHSGMESLRGLAELTDDSRPPEMAPINNNDEPVVRNYVQQPPVIPHDIRGYEIDLRVNKCLSCHSWDQYKKSGATKVSLTHFQTRDGHALAEISPRRYFCLQCHVPQALVTPLVGNAYQSTTDLKNQ